MEVVIQIKGEFGQQTVVQRKGSRRRQAGISTNPPKGCNRVALRNAAPVGKQGHEVLISTQRQQFFCG